MNEETFFGITISLLVVLLALVVWRRKHPTTPTDEIAEKRHKEILREIEGMRQQNSAEHGDLQLRHRVGNKRLHKIMRTFGIKLDEP